VRSEEVITVAVMPFTVVETSLPMVLAEMLPPPPAPVLPPADWEDDVLGIAPEKTLTGATRKARSSLSFNAAPGRRRRHNRGDDVGIATDPFP
jgi:hypothetical protein